MQKYNFPKKKIDHPQKSSTIQSGSTTDTYNHHADSISQFTTFLRMIKNKRRRNTILFEYKPRLNF